MATELFQWLQNCYGDKEEGIKFKVLEIILVAEKMAIDNGKMIQDTMERSKYLEIVANVPTQDYLLKWFLEKLEEVSRNMAIVDTAQINETKGKEVGYLYEKYKNSVTLDEVCKCVNSST